MRLTPTEEQRAYLTEIGALSRALSNTAPGDARRFDLRTQATGETRSRIARWILPLCILIAISLLLVGIARSEEQFVEPDSTANIPVDTLKHLRADQNSISKSETGENVPRDAKTDDLNNQDSMSTASNSNEAIEKNRTDIETDADVSRTENSREDTQQEQDTLKPENPNLESLSEPENRPDKQIPDNGSIPRSTKANVNNVESQHTPSVSAFHQPEDEWKREFDTFRQAMQASIVSMQMEARKNHENVKLWIAELRSKTDSLSAASSRQENSGAISPVLSILAKTNSLRALAEHDLDSIEDDIDTLKESTTAHQRLQLVAISVFGLLFLLNLILLILYRRRVNNRLRNIEQDTILFLLNSQLQGVSVDYSGVESRNSPITLVQESELRQTYNPPAQKAKQSREPLSGWLESKLDIANQSALISHIPVVPSEPWRLGLASIKGHVRSENQDCGLCFSIAGQDVMIVADGCGGLPHGQRAAIIAATHAALYIIRRLSLKLNTRRLEIQDLAQGAIENASRGLNEECKPLENADLNEGLRTTLIVVIGNAHEFGYSYIGDGGGHVLHSSGEIRSFLDPQKAPGQAANVLAASLGPQMIGQPVTGSLIRKPGDLVVIGSDGIFDRVNPNFAKDVLDECIRLDGNLQKTAERIVEELASVKDSAGYICDDNLTLGIMGDGCAPILPQGFWHNTDKENPIPSEQLPLEETIVEEELS